MAEVWRQTADIEEGDLTDFDSSTPAWDAKVDEKADFDSVVDVDGDLNDAVAAAHDGAVGLEITFDDANAAYGVANLSAVNQTSGVIPFWINKNNVAIEDGKHIRILYCKDGAAANSWALLLGNNGGDVQILPAYYDDASVIQIGSWQTITAGYHKIDFHFKRSTGVGNDNGWMRLYIDDVLLEYDTGHDNDTRDWDFVRVGMAWTNSTTFGGSYYMDSIRLDPVGAPMADKLAAVNGTYGMSIPIMDTTARYVTFTDPTAETRITTECNFELNSLTMANGDAFQILTNSVDLVYLSKDAGGYYLQVLKGLDAGNTWGTQGAYITDTNHHIRLISSFSTGVGNDDGYYLLYVDNVLYISETGLDNDTKTAGTVDFGAISGIDAGTYGIIRFDDCKWADKIFAGFLGRIIIL